MLKDIVSVIALENYSIKLRFEDGVEGVVNVADLVEFSGVFSPLKDANFFAQVRVNPELGTICWPNDADLDPDVLYSTITGQPLPEFGMTIETPSLSDSTI